MTSESTTREQLYHLLQLTYFNGIDGANPDQAVEALHESISWRHTQVWEHDGHDRSTTDTLVGRETVREFLTRRIEQMQVVGIKHKVGKVLTDGEYGAFRAVVVGPTGKSVPFLGWVELEEGKISSYMVMPEL
jgi:hypothetical protein